MSSMITEVICERKVSMKSTKEITEFVERVCDSYSIFLPVFIKGYDERSQSCPENRVFKDGTVDPDTLQLLSKVLGMSTEDITETNNEAARRIAQKYPFFSLLRMFEQKKTLANDGITDVQTPSPEELLLFRIFGNSFLGDKTAIQDYLDTPKKVKEYQEDLLERLKKQLLEFDRYLPGTFHPNGEITQLHHESNRLFNFPQYSQMMESFFAVYDRMQSLFFKALKTDLSSEEQNEYNLFVSYFRAQEWGFAAFLHYDVLCKHRSIMISVGYHELDSYLRINGFTTNFEPWTCRQFAEYAEYAQRYQDIYPGTKESIKELCMHIKYIYCAFKWSDAPWIEDDEFEWVPDDDCPKKYQEWTRVYIPKTEEEIGDDAKCSALLRKMASPESKGGLKKRKTEIPRLDLDLLKKRVELRRSEGAV